MLENVSPDFEGIFFLTENGDEYRIGQDEAAPITITYQKLNQRLIGLSAKFGSEF